MTTTAPPRLVLGADADREKWLAARRGGVSATEAAVVAGLIPSAWDAPFALFHRKTGDLPEIEPNDVMRLGTELEPYVCRRYAEAHQKRTVRPGGLYAHPQRDWQLATPDRLVFDTTDRPGVYAGDYDPAAALEAKTVSSWDDWGESDADVPVYYRAQCLWQLDVLGLDTVHLAAVNRTTGAYREYVVTRDEGDLEVLRSEAEAFLHRIRVGDPPDLDASPATTRALKGLWPEADDTQAEVPGELAARYARACAGVKDAQSFKTQAENEIRAALRTARRAVCDGHPVATRSIYARAGYYVPPTPEDQPIDRLVPAKRRNPWAA